MQLLVMSNACFQQSACFLPECRLSGRKEKTKEHTVFTMRLRLPERMEAANDDPFRKTFILCVVVVVVVVVFVNYN